MIATATEMKAIVQDVYGSADVLQLREIDKPEPKEGEVLLRVRAAGVDPGVWHLMMGRPYLVRAMGFGIRAPKVHGRGREVAGTVEAVGADQVIDYTREDFAQSGKRYDVILDTGGRRPLSVLRKALSPKGTLVIVGGEGGGPVLGGFDRQIFRAPLLSLFTGQNLRPLVTKESADHLVAMGKLMESGKVKSIIDRTFPLDGAPDAIRYLAEGRARGKVVIAI